MNTKRLIVESAVKAALKEASGLQVISSEALEWVNAQAAAAAADCAARGRRTPGGPLMAPDGSIAFPTVTTELRQDGRQAPERLCYRAKEWAAMTVEQKTEHLHKLYISAPTINQEAIELLIELTNRSDVPVEILNRAHEIIQAAKDLQP